MARPYSYAAQVDVQARIPWFRITATSVPNATQVTDYCAQASNDLDAQLARQNYSTPVPSSAAVAFDQLRTWAALGAAVKTIEGMPQGTESKHYGVLAPEWAEILTYLERGEATLVDAPRDPRQNVRSAGNLDPRFVNDRRLR